MLYGTKEAEMIWNHLSNGTKKVYHEVRKMEGSVSNERARYNKMVEMSRRLHGAEYERNEAAIYYAGLNIERMDKALQHKYRNLDNQIHCDVKLAEDANYVRKMLTEASAV